MAYTIASKRHDDICATVEISAQDHTERREAEHQGIELVFGITKPLNYSIGGNDKPIQPGQFLVYNAREPHSETYQQTNANFQTIIINDVFINRFLNETSLKVENLIFENPQFKPSDSLRNLVGEVFLTHEAVHLSSQYMEFLVSQLFLELLTSLPNTLSPELQTRVNQAFFPCLVRKAQRYMRENLTEPNLDLTQLSNYVGISKFHLLRQFKKATGMSPVHYFQHMRADLVKSRLTKLGDRTITDVAFDLNFSHLSSFYSLFSRKFGMTPSQYLQAIATLPRQVQSRTYRYGLCEF